MKQPSRPLRVLIVDDEPLISWAIGQTLADRGDAIIEAATGAAAVRALTDAKHAMDVVLLDYRLPGIQNLDLLALVRSLSPSSRVILMSGWVTPQIVADALALGAARVVMKPIDMEDVPALVHGALVGRSLAPAPGARPGAAAGIN
jgi:DNA-binding NtrC family response regulator